MIVNLQNTNVLAFLSVIKECQFLFPWYIVMFGVHPTFQIYLGPAGLSFLLMVVLGYHGCIF